MPDLPTLILFAAAAAALVFTPGPNTLYVIARSVEQGRTAAIVSCLGVEVGTMLHVAAAALGVSALLASSAAAFAVLKYAGAAYLLFVGLKTLLAKGEAVAASTVRGGSLRRAFCQAVLVNVLNPKSAIFFLAFMPQFVDPRRGSAAAQILVFGAVVVVLGFTSGSLYSLLAGSVAGALRGSRRLVRAQRYFAGGIYIALGAATALTGQGAK